jgi:soluble lytic murein transglycosylase-like protein
VTPPQRSWKGDLPLLAVVLVLGCAPFLNTLRPPDPRVAPAPAREVVLTRPAPRASVPAPVLEPAVQEQVPPVPAPAPASDPSLVAVERALAAVATKLTAEERSAVGTVISRAEREAGLPALLLVALIQQESRFDRRAVGPRGARGLMQLRPFVALAVASRNGISYDGQDTLFDPVRNVEIGTAYLAELRRRFGTVELALAAYNRGPGRVRRDLRRGGEPRYQFVAQVLGRYDAYDRRFGLPPSPASLASEAAQ